MTFDIQQAVEEANEQYFQEYCYQQHQMEQERRLRLESILIKCSTVLDGDEMAQLRMECGA